MTNTDKARNTAQTVKGKVKAATGKVTGKKRLETDGKIDQAKGKAKKLGETLKDVMKK